MSKKKTDIQEWAEQPHGEIKALKGEISKLNKRLRKYQSGEGLIIEAVEEAIANNPPTIVAPRPPQIRSKGLREVAVMHVSDTQIGKVTESYDPTVCRDRLLMMGEKAIEITKMRRQASRIDECHVYYGGDMVEGENIFPSQAHEIDQCVFDQAIRTAPSIMAELVLLLLGSFKKVKVLCVRGNHGRNGRFSSTKTNWDSVSYRVMELMLLGPHAPADLKKRLEIQIADDTFWLVDRIFDWGNLLVHGDQIRGGFGGFPWYGFGKKIWGWIDTIPEPFEYVFTGHFHTPASAVLNHRMFLANGTTESDNEYALESLAAGGTPAQRLCFFNSKHGMIADHLIWLAKRTPQRKKAKEW